MRRPLLAWLPGVLVGTLLLAATVQAQSSGRELELQVQQITSELRCPTCQALSVNDSEADFSRQIKLKVRNMLQEGQSPEQIKAYFVSRYGEWILRAPKKEGLGLVLWLAPAAALLGVGAWVFFRARRASQEHEVQAQEVVQATSVSEAQRERIQRDLRWFEEGE